MSAPRVAYLLKKFPRLSETFVLNEILQQERLGTEVRVYARRPADDEPRHPEFARLLAPIEQLRSDDRMEPWLALFGHDAASHDLLARFGALVRELSDFRHERMPSLFAEALVVLGRARAERIEHIHAHFATDSALVAMLVHDLGGPPYSVTAHAKDIYRSTVNPRLLSRLVARSSFTVTVCDANVRHLEGILEPAAMAKVRRLYNGIDLESFQPRGVERDANHVLCVARLVEKKGFPVLVRALRLLADRGFEARATFVGEGEDRAKIEAEIARCGMGAKIALTGALDQQKVRDLMARATVMALPCVIGEDGNRDALPTTLIESLAMGLPCISTPVVGIPEILDGGRCGVIVPEEDDAAVAEAVESLCKDAARRAELARLGRARAEQCFDGRASARTLQGWFAESARAAAESCR
ncbi:MAG: glycosyltransferase [Planctomycetia bacterium]